MGLVTKAHHTKEVHLSCDKCGWDIRIQLIGGETESIDKILAEEGFDFVRSGRTSELLCRKCLKAEDLFVCEYNRHKNERLRQEAKEILGKNYYEADDIMEIFRKNKDKQHKKAFNRIINSLKDRAERGHLLEHLVSDRDSRERSDEFMAIIEYKEHFRAMGYKVKVPDDGFSSDSRIAKVEVEDPFKDH